MYILYSRKKPPFSPVTKNNASHLRRTPATVSQAAVDQANQDSGLVGTLVVIHLLELKRTKDSVLIKCDMENMSNQPVEILRASLSAACEGMQIFDSQTYYQWLFRDGLSPQPNILEWIPTVNPGQSIVYECAMPTFYCDVEIDPTLSGKVLYYATDAPRDLLVRQGGVISTVPIQGSGKLQFLAK